MRARSPKQEQSQPKLARAAIGKNQRPDKTTVASTPQTLRGGHGPCRLRRIPSRLVCPQPARVAPIAAPNAPALHRLASSSDTVSLRSDPPRRQRTAAASKKSVRLEIPGREQLQKRARFVPRATPHQF